MKKYIIISLLAISFIISPALVSAQTSQQNQIIHLLQSLIQLLQQQLQVLRMQNTQPLSPQQRADILRNLQQNPLTPVPTGITILSPNGGENLIIGGSKLVTWRGNVATLSLLRYPYILDCLRGPGEEGTRGCNPNPNVQYNIVEFPNATAGSYVWRIGQYNGQNSSVGQTVSSGSYAMLACRGLEYSDTACDISDSYFTIYSSNQPVPSVQVFNPNGGETFRVGGQIGIAYNIVNVPSADTLSIRLEKLSGLSFTQIIADTPSNNFREAYWWTIPATFPIGNDYKITIYAKDSTGKIVAQDSSDMPFTIGH
ncbi:MAG: hypothetical protein V1704_04895 [Candidatus Vogelbacteria bacterium]